MRKIIKKIIVILLSFACLLSTTPVYAKTKLKGYTIETSSLKSPVSSYITALRLEEELDGSYSLYINNEYIGSKSGSSLSFSYYPNSLLSINMNIVPSNGMIAFSWTQKNEAVYNSAFVFMLDEDANQTVIFYPSASSSSNTQSRTTKASGGVYDFGSFSCTLGEKNITFSLTLNANNNTATIVKNGTSKTYSVNKTSNIRTLYFENFVEGHAINMNYMEKDLAKQTYANAKTVDYSDDAIENAVQNEKLTLINSTTNQTYTINLSRVIGYWNRTSGGEAGTGTYGDEPTSTIQVVCEWHDTACASIRSQYTEAGRLYAVYGSSTSYPSITSYTKSEYIYPTLYQNWNWYDSGWSSASTSYPTSLGTYGIVQYKYRTKNYSDYSDWQTDPINCGSFCQYVDIENKTFYAFRTRGWGAWSEYNLTSCSTDDTNLKQCEAKTLYRQAFRSYGSWSAWSEDNKCGLLTGSTCEDESRERYRYRTRTYTAAYFDAWSSWSSYAYSLLGCSETTMAGEKTKECRSTTAYSYRKIGDWSAWSSYTTSACNVAYAGANNTQTVACMSKTQKCEKTRSTNGYTYSGYKYTYGSKPSPAYNCSSSTVTSSSCGTTTQYRASCTCLAPTSKKNKTCTGSWSTSKSACTISGCTSRRCSYSSKSVNKSCTRYYCATSRSVKYTDWSSCSYVDGTCSSNSTYYNCTSRTVYAKRTRSFGSYGDYTLDTTYKSNSLYDYKTQTWYGYRTRDYHAQVIGDWTSWTDYVYASCSSVTTSGYLTKECNSQTQYRKRVLGEYGAWGSYNVELNSSEYTSCASSNLCKQEGKTFYRTRSRNNWSSWTSYDYPSCTEATTGTTLRECKSVTKYRFSTITYSDWSSWYRTTSSKTNSDTIEYLYRYNNGSGSWSETKGTSSVLGTNTYYTGESKTSTTKKLVNVKYAQKTNKTIGTLSEMTASDIAAKTSSIKSDLINYGAYNALNTSPVLYEDMQEYASSQSSSLSSQAAQDALKYFEQKVIFIPYFYITPHWRATSHQTTVDGFNNQTITSATNSYYYSSDSQNMTLVEYDIDITKNTKVIYYDYLDPLTNYEDELPENWQGYEALVEEIKNSDISNYKISVEMSKQDLDLMKKWLETHDYDSSNCEMLKEFSYIFKTTNSELSDFLSSGKGCHIEEDN